MSTPIKNKVGETNKHRKKRSQNSAPTGNSLQTRATRSTNADQIHNLLRSQIISMELRPGTLLAENEIAATYNVSRTPVREALLRLADEMLVEVVPKSGTFVSRIALSILPDILLIRRSLESITVRYAAKYATRSQLTTLKANLELQEEFADSGNFSGFHQTDEEFHHSIATMGGRGGIWNYIDNVKVHVDRCRHLSLPQEGRMFRALEEHRSIYQCLVGRDSKQAELAMNEHLDRFRVDMPQFRDLYPDYFIHDIDLEEAFSQQI
ncbi:MAG: GntR family transcriptional regulator [Rhodothermales bacterium]